MTNNKPMDFQKPNKEKMISWTAPEFIHYPKDTSWYLTIGLGALILAGVFFWMKNYLGMVVVILTPLVFYLISRGRAKQIKYLLNKEGLSIGEKNYPFEQLKTFWIIEGPLFATLYLETTKKFLPPLTIYLLRVNHQEVREFLKEYLPEQEGKKEIIHDQISRFLRF